MGLPRRKMSNSKAQTSGKSKVLTVKIWTEMHFRKTCPVTNQAVSLKLSVYLDFQSYFFELATGIHCFNVLCKILLLSKLINKSIHSQNGRKNSQNNRVPKCEVIENEICEIMGFVKIF